MENSLKSDKLSLKKNEELLKISALDFVSIGIACHALCLIENAGILKILTDKGVFRENQISKFDNPHLIKAALVTLTGTKVLHLKNGYFSLSRLGKELAKNVGLLGIPLVGYRKLFFKQFEILKNPSAAKYSDIDFSAIALASINFGANDLNPLLIDIFKALKPKGTICDLGCGTGEKLVKICKATNSPGLGIEKSNRVITESKQYIKNSRVEIVEGDVFKLKDVWEDVDIAMMSQVCHDMDSTECSKVLSSLQTNFPNMKCLVIVDIVSLSEKVPTIMPGFDYVHGLQGFTPRNYEETLETFRKGNYTIFQETAVPNMPNTYIWLLKPNRSVEKY